MTDFQGEPTGVLENHFLRLEYLKDAPRIVRFTPANRRNLFAELDRSATPTTHGDFYFRGGHRLWHSPEAMPRTYMPDNHGALVTEIEGGVRIDQPAEVWTHIAKRLEIQLDPNQARVHVRHELRNEGAWTVELAAWALTMLRPGGVGIFPQPTGNVDANGLLPNRQITLWPYSNAQDARFRLDDEFILVQAAPQVPPLKFGYLNLHGWIGYWSEACLFVKRFDAPSAAVLFPDGGCNVESYCNDRFIELETLGPLTQLAPGESLSHTEVWEVFDSLNVEFIPPEARAAITGLLK